jgi:transcriptional regulator with XRE-family HTH domain
VQDARVGSLLRALRIKRSLRQADVAREAGLSRQLVSLIEAGRIDRTSLHALRRVAAAVGATLDLDPRWRGGEIDRLISEAHTRLHESVARFVETLAGWDQAPEVAFAIGAERGVIDILAFHVQTRSLLVIELKSELTDLGYLLATTSRRVRLGVEIAAERGWRATSVSAWVIVAESPANRRLAGRFQAMIRSALPADGHAVRAWLRRPRGRSLACPSGPTPRRLALRRGSRLAAAFGRTPLARLPA